MKTNGEQLVNDISLYIAKGAIPHPVVYFEFLTQLNEMAKRERASMVPLAMLEYFTLRVNRKIQVTIQRKMKKAA